MDYLDKLEESLKVFENETDKLSKIPILIENIAVLISQVEEVKEDNSAQHKHLLTIKQEMEEESKRIKEYIEVEKDSRNEFISVVKNSLLQSSQENMELYNSLSKTMANKIDVAVSDLNAVVVKNSSNISEELGSTQKKIRDADESMSDKFKSVIRDLEEVKKIEPQVRKLHLFSLISVITGVVACILLVMQLVS